MFYFAKRYKAGGSSALLGVHSTITEQAGATAPALCLHSKWVLRSGQKGRAPEPLFAAMLRVATPARLIAPLALFARCAPSLRLGPKGFTLWNPDKGQRPLTRFFRYPVAAAHPRAPHSAFGAVRALRTLAAAGAKGFHPLES